MSDIVLYKTSKLHVNAIMIENQIENQKENIYIIQPVLDESYHQLQSEAVALIESCGAAYAGTIYQKIREINPSTYIGEGKLAELAERLQGLDLTILFNGELTPSQTLNISAALGDKKVIDRTTLILDIFARNAKSNEGKLQVELAQLQYMYPRLKGKGSALSRLGGRIGTRGPGETKLETDRRRIRERVHNLEGRLSAIENSRKLIASRRKKDFKRTISLVGYTNTGKSTLLNKLTGAGIYAADRLFATLDTTSRKLVIDGREYLLTDTVGFLRALPHDLISAFHSTLESALNCDLLLIVCDATDDYKMQLDTTLKTLRELHCEVPYKIVMNKSEKLTSFDAFPQGCIFISAKEGIGLEGLKSEIEEFFSDRFTTVRLHIPYSRLQEYEKIKKFATEKNSHYGEEFAEIEAEIDKRYIDRFSSFR